MLAGTSWSVADEMSNKELVTSIAKSRHGLLGLFMSRNLKKLRIAFEDCRRGVIMQCSSTLGIIVSNLGQL